MQIFCKGNWLPIALVVFSGTLQAGELRLGIMPSSHHFNSEAQYNEHHSGVLVEYRLDSDDWIGAMVYDNSFDDSSNAYYWLREYDITDYLSWGHSIGAVTGYKEGRPMGYAGVNLNLHWGRFGARVAMVPFVVAGRQAYLEF